jgi:hypothetical protein
MWAVGLLGDIDEGYAIWPSEDFTTLFWNDAPSSSQLQLMEMTQDVVHDVCIGSNNIINNGGLSSTKATTGDGIVSKEHPAAIATMGSREIIEKDREHLQRVFLLQQEESVGKKQMLLDEEVGENAVNATPLRVVRMKDHDQIPPPQSIQQPTETKKEKWSKRRDFLKRRDKKSLRSRESSAILQPEPPVSTTTDLRRTRSAPSTPSPTKVSLSQLLDRSTHIAPPLQPKASTQSLLTQHFPPLSKRVVHQISFPGLHTEEFFRVFFDDDAPYSMRDFQMKRGDVDVIYSKWGGVGEEKEMLASFKVDGDSE